MTLEAAYNETGPKIVGYLVATGSDEATARDILHDAFARMVARGEKPGDDLCALAFTTARNLRANRVRDDSRLSVVERPEDLDNREDLVGLVLLLLRYYIQTNHISLVLCRKCPMGCHLCLR